ncbi:DUF805 domain-containing protein (plasmid) [Deinococcus radiomollis]|uniref:DUF805 domain-containing protein n=1 Tax=Deinococcus radiomollis TaxID=468916 RepID=UPI003892775E
MNEYLKAYRNYANFTGRSRRRDYWMFVLISTLISLGLQFVITLLGGNLLDPTNTSSVSPFALVLTVIYGIYILATIVPNIAINVRRLHDVGYSGWVFLIVLIPIVGPIVLLVFDATDSKPGTNQWGQNPKGQNATLLV